MNSVPTDGDWGATSFTFSGLTGAAGCFSRRGHELSGQPDDFLRRHPTVRDRHREPNGPAVRVRLRWSDWFLTDERSEFRDRRQQSLMREDAVDVNGSRGDPGESPQQPHHFVLPANLHHQQHETASRTGQR